MIIFYKVLVLVAIFSTQYSPWDAFLTFSLVESISQYCPLFLLFDVVAYTFWTSYHFENAIYTVGGRRKKKYYIQ